MVMRFVAVDMVVVVVVVVCWSGRVDLGGVVRLFVRFQGFAVRGRKAEIG